MGQRSRVARLLPPDGSSGRSRATRLLWPIAPQFKATSMIPLLLLAVSLHTNFEAGSLGKVEPISATHFRCAVKGEVDQKGRNRQASWYYFRLDGAAGREITLDFVDLLGEYNFSSGELSIKKTTRPAFSHDNKTWQFFGDQEVQWDNLTTSLRLRFTPCKKP